MKILFLGDSYSNNDSGWPLQVTQALNATSVNLSRAGSSLNYMFTKLDAELEKNFYDVVIVTITSGDRLFHGDKIITSGNPIYNDGTPIVGDERKAIDLFYTYLWDRQNRDINGRIFQLAMTTISLVHPKTKFIFLPAFDEWKRSSIGNYVYTYPKLLHASYLDMKSQKMEEQGSITDRLNHLTKNQNTDLADQIVRMINYYDFNSATACKLHLDKL
jgi:hypothetical protein